MARAEKKSQLTTSDKNLTARTPSLRPSHRNSLHKEHCNQATQSATKSPTA